MWLHFVLSGVAALSASPGMARVDSLLVSNGLVKNRAAAKRALAAGVVTTNCGAVITKASKTLACDARLIMAPSSTAGPTGESGGGGGSMSSGAGSSSGVSDAVTSTLDNSMSSGAGSSSSVSEALTSALDSSELLAPSVEAFAKPERPQTAAARSALRGGAARAARLANQLEEVKPMTQSEILRKGGGRHHPAKHFSKKNKRGTA